MAQKIIKPAKPSPAANQSVFNFPLRNKYIFLALIGFVFYANSILNKYAFDDYVTIETNGFVQMGFSGIPKILTNDSYASYYIHLGGDPSSTQLAGGRYRPLPEIVFAIEQQLFGNFVLLPYFRHLISVLAYVACVLAIFYFLEKFLMRKIRGGSDIAFIAAFIFTIHPIHTEVVANLKSLDEILSLLFIMLTFIFSLIYIQSRQTKHLVIGSGLFLLALLSKEYAVTLLFLIPILFYQLENKKPGEALIASIPYYGVFLVYLILRYNAVGFHSNIQSSSILMDNPYAYATPLQKLATEWFVLGKYLGLLFFPYPLSYDYSYYQIPYRNFSDIIVLLSMIIYVGIIIYGIMLCRKKNVLSFAVFFFLFTIITISNFTINIGATMGDRLVFHSSLGFVIILSYYLFNIIPKAFSIPKLSKKNVAIGAMSTIGVISFGETTMRNVQWKDNNSLFIHDVKVVPNSYLANSNAGWSYLSLSRSKENNGEQSKAYRDSGRKYLFRALRFNPKNEFTYSTLGTIYLDQGLLDSAKYCFDMVYKLHPNLPDLKSQYILLSHHYFNRGLSLAKENDKPREGILYMKKALLIDSINADIWYNIGVAYFRIHQYDSAEYALVKALHYKPDYADAKRGLQAISSVKEK